MQIPADRHNASDDADNGLDEVPNRSWNAGIDLPGQQLGVSSRAIVDVVRGGVEMSEEMHADEEAVPLDDGSSQKSVGNQSLTGASGRLSMD